MIKLIPPMISKKIDILFYLIVASLLTYHIALILNSYINYKLNLNLIELAFNTSKQQYTHQYIPKEDFKLDQIVKKNIFHVLESIKQKEKSENDQISIEDLPVAKIEDLELRGIVWSDKRENRIAIIYDKKIRLEGIYSIGDSITGGRVKDILKDQIIVTINGKESRIPLSDYTAIEKDVNVTKHTNYVISKDILKSKLSNMPALLRSMKVIPYTARGVRGFKVVSINDKFIKNKIGLKRGDIILAVNGKEVTNMNNIMELYSKVQDIDSVELEILRNGEKQSLSFSIK